MRAYAAEGPARNGRPLCDPPELCWGLELAEEECDGVAGGRVEAAVVGQVGPTLRIDRHLLEVAQLTVARAVDATGADDSGLGDGGIGGDERRERGAAIGRLDVALEPLRGSRNSAWGSTGAGVVQRHRHL